MMASAEKKIVKTETFTLALSSEEASALFDLVYRHVNGVGAREHLDKIGEALDCAGVEKHTFMALGSGIVTYEDPKPAKSDAPLKVGEHVRVTRSWLRDYIGLTGVLIAIERFEDGDDAPYRVEFPDGVNSGWHQEVERVAD
jgi:hypothetical protein